jgi:hypothetical protein
VVTSFPLPLRWQCQYERVKRRYSFGYEESPVN